jgi:SAM-dependent methyltransferase
MDPTSTTVRSSNASRTAEVNGPLWGHQANDWSRLMEPVFQPVYDAAFDRCAVHAGTRLLDAGCGSGLAAQTAAHRGASVAGVDAAEALLRVARARVPDADFHVADLESLPFDNHEFDVVTGFNSFQYAGTPRLALSEARRVAKPCGIVLIMVWGRPEGMQAASTVAALRPVLPPPPPNAPGPFALSDETMLRGFAESAGLDAEDLFDVDAPWTFGSHDTAMRALRSAGVAARAIAHSGQPAVDEALSKSLEPFRQADGSYRIGATFRCLLTRA